MGHFEGIQATLGDTREKEIDDEEETEREIERERETKRDRQREKDRQTDRHIGKLVQVGSEKCTQ